MSFIELTQIKEREILPGCVARFVHSDSMTVSYWNLESAAVVPEHSHPHEQVTTLIQGKLELTVDGETRVIEPGSVVNIGPNVSHSVKALMACYVIDVFHPVREDYR